MSNQFLALDIRKHFGAAVGAQPKKKNKRPSPFTIRFSEEERAYLDGQAGKQSLGAFIRQEILKNFDKATTQPKQRLRKPAADEKKIAALLAELGKSRLPSNLNQLAKAVNSGTLDVRQDTDQKLQEASEVVLAMREALFMALGLRCGRDE